MITVTAVRHEFFRSSLKAFLYCLLISSCTVVKEDPCEGITCLNGGACIDGTCDCPIGFNGKFCENKVVCSYTAYSGTGNCATDKVTVATGICCPSGFPFYCALNNTCYTTCEETDDACTGAVTKGTTNAGNNSATGQIMFWTKSDFGCGNISVSINGITQTITSHYSVVPSCGASGSGNFTLAPGMYNYTASCTGKSWSGTIEVTSGGCFKVELNSGATTTSNGQVFFWANKDCGCGNIKVSIDGAYVGETSYPYSGVTPLCGESGFLSKTIAVGSHAFTAECIGSEWSGTFNVTANTCTPQELACSTAGKITFWTKLNEQISVALYTMDSGCAFHSHPSEEIIKTTQYYSSSPSGCNAAGCATFTRPEGRFTYTASSATKSWSGCVTISTGCVLFELK